ncbi:MAG: ABC transporter ATP-binding protein [Candidatus Omnitrophica bacterium]|nr:ABC transporter ATP-binding protein [Candidatus Omnitrophota bacterium]
MAEATKPASSTEAEPHVVVESLYKSFAHNGGRVEVLQEINLSIRQGEFVCLLGPSGCGKSTLINIIAGLDAPDRGRVLIHGQPVTRPGVDRVVVFQDASLFPWLTVLGNVEFGPKMQGIASGERRAKALELIKLVHLSKFANAYPYQLSGGMKQRVAIARALAMDPEILLMDEPFGALDAQTRGMLQRELLEIWQATGKTVVFVTHNVREATGLGERVFEISARPGRIKHAYAVDLPQPRSNSDPRLLSLQQKILGSLGEEIAKVMQDETGLPYEPQEGRVAAAPDRALGMHI